MKSFFKYISFSLVSATIFNGCIKEDFFKDDDMSINMEAHVGSPVLAVKSVNSPKIDYDSQEELAISLVRWDKSGSTSAVGKSVIPAIMGKPSNDGLWRRKINFAQGHTQYYSSRADEVGFAAWYPDENAAGWVKENGNVIHSDNKMRYNIDGKTDVMVSDMAKGSFEQGMESLKFRHALCLFNIYAYAVDEETRLEWGNLNQVIMKNFTEQLTVILPQDMTTGMAQFTFDGASKEYSLLQEGSSNILHTGTPDKEKCKISTIIAGVPQDKRLGITISTEKQKDGNSISIARDFKPGYAYNIFLRLSTRGVINAEVTTADWVYDQNEYIIDENFSLMANLSRYGTSNCYIASSGNRGYSFDATVKGNGVNTLSMENGKTVTLPDKDVNIIGIDAVKILRSDAMMKLVNGKWEFIADAHERMNTPLIELVTDKLSFGRVLFKTIGDKNNPDNNALLYKGNVKIGVLDKAGNILWSWHIWVTDRPKNQGYSNGYVALDRNLGAVTTDYNEFIPEHSHWSGFYYQFGRKDPIYRATVDANFGVPGIEYKVEKHAVTVAEAHRNPTTYFYDLNGNNWTTDTESAHFWGYKTVREDIVKTIYDPCPPGYRVPGTGIFEQSDANVIINKVNSKNGTLAGYKFKIGDFIEVYYPTTICVADGQIHANDLKQGTSKDKEEYIFLSVATPYDPTLYNISGEKYNNLAWHFRYHGEAMANAFNTVVSDPDKFHSKRSSAFPVRCVLEDSKPEVTDLSRFQTANSYVVSNTGFYKFNATKRGNGVTGLNIVTNQGSTYRTFDAGMGEHITGIDRIDILWWQGDLTPDSDYMKFASGNPTQEEIETKIPIRMLDNGHLRDGNISFMASANKDTWGNVGLAAYDENDNILWTWHIWIQPGVNVIRLGNYTVMDRNLGATYAPTSNNEFNPNRLEANIGFYYQWGRKDPFFTSSNRNAGSGQNTMPWFYKNVKTGRWEKKESFDVKPKGTIPESTANPLTFFKADTNPGIWQTTYGASNDSPANDLWGYVGIALTIGDSFAKTMYDPCPPGYRVMQHNVFESANICDAHSTVDYKLEGYSYTNNSNNQFGIFFNNTLTGKDNKPITTSGLWFPNSGYIDNKGNFILNTATPVAKISTATPYANGQILNCREMSWKRSRSATLFDYYFKQNNNSYHAEGRVVRCQME